MYDIKLTDIEKLEDKFDDIITNQKEMLLIMLIVLYKI